jgi:hypothetical protein
LKIEATRRDCDTPLSVYGDEASSLVLHYFCR